MHRSAHLLFGLALAGGACAVGGTNDGAGTHGLVQGLTVQNGNHYELDTLNTGKAVYADRPYVFTKVPAALDGADYIRTSNNDKLVREAGFVRFTLARPATVYVAYDSRASRLPDWLQSWTPTDEVAATDDVPHRMLKRSFPAGRVALGGNQGDATGAGSNYTVIIRAN